MENINQSPQTSGNPQGHSQTASPAGNGQPDIKPQYDIGAFNGIGVDPSKVVALSQSKKAVGQATTQGQTVTHPDEERGQKGTEETKVEARQPTEKDERHFAKFVTKAAQEKYDFAKLAVEANADAIFSIAETDKDLAQRLLKEYDYGTTDVDELLEKRQVSNAKNPEDAQKQLQEAKWKKDMEKQLLDEKILRLKGEHSDLTGEVEEAFRQVYSDPAMSKYNETQKLAVARAIAGKAPEQNSADNVALAILQREQGIATSPRGAVQTEKMKVISPEMKKMLAAANLTEKSLDVLPPNIDELIAQQFGSFAH